MPYNDIVRASEDYHISRQVSRLTDWDDWDAGILSMESLTKQVTLFALKASITQHLMHDTRALNLFGMRPHNYFDITRTYDGYDEDRVPMPDAPKDGTLPLDFKWIGDFRDKSGRKVECLGIRGQRNPVRIWMVGMLDDLELGAFSDRPGIAQTIMRPLNWGGLHGANALLRHFTPSVGTHKWHEPDDAILSTWSKDQDPDKLNFTGPDYITIDRDDIFPNDHLFDAYGLDNPITSRTVLSDTDFHIHDFVLQECFFAKVTRSLATEDVTAYFILRKVYKLSPPASTT
ncbi:hypothetical protein BV25DRAFT_1922406 [Artomyces pyxidatus]|uniref:Uncharacterized protein n=1 Tax=Artomyces pyxidatus TaxID=48021 RepID=A0ACB8SG57_9AGAM|nr:hypothetical protein BV25DRAFT_1922406 [Artomyces pyxidatus]